MSMMRKSSKVGIVFLIGLTAVALPVKSYDARSTSWQPQIKLVGSAKLPGSFVSPQVIYADAERIFVTISSAGDKLAPAERVKTIYPRYTAADPAPGPRGLAVLAFRTGTPYQGEDLIYDATTPANFLVRCTRDTKDPARTAWLLVFYKQIALFAWTEPAGSGAWPNSACACM